MCPEPSVVGLDGSADVEVRRVCLTLDVPRGTRSVLNRFGDITVRLADQPGAVTGEVRSRSGRVRLPASQGRPGGGQGYQLERCAGAARWARRGELERPAAPGAGDRDGADSRPRLHSEAGAVVLVREGAPVPKP